MKAGRDSAGTITSQKGAPRTPHMQHGSGREPMQLGAWYITVVQHAS